MRSASRIVVAAALIAALGACKKKESEDHGPAPAKAAPADAAPRVAVDAAGAPAVALDAAPAPANDGAPTAAGGKIPAFFYAVERDGKVSHLLGTMHIGVEVEQLPDVVLATLGTAKTFGMEAELDLGALGDMKLPEGQTLEKLLGPEYWKKLRDAIGGQMADALATFKPSAVAPLLEIRGLPMTQAMDMVLLGKAKEHGAKLEFMETAAFQQKLLDKWEDLQALKDGLDDLDKGQAKTKELLAAYLAGDEAAVLRLNSDRSDWKRSAAEYDQMMLEMLYDRNASWIPKLEALFREGDVFVAVGVAHLLGDGSVIDLLRKDGYTITRVPR